MVKKATKSTTSELRQKIKELEAENAKLRIENGKLIIENAELKGRLNALGDIPIQVGHAINDAVAWGYNMLNGGKKPDGVL